MKIVRCSSIVMAKQRPEVKIISISKQNVQRLPLWIGKRILRTIREEDVRKQEETTESPIREEDSDNAEKG